MHIAEILTLRDYYRDFRFRGRIDNLPNYARSTNRWVLIAKEFFYFGANAKGIQSIPSQNLAHPFEKMGPGFRSDFTQAFIRDFESWLTPNLRSAFKGRLAEVIRAGLFYRIQVVRLVMVSPQKGAATTGISAEAHVRIPPAVRVAFLPTEKGR